MKCLRIGIFVCAATARIKPSPPRGMTRSIESSIARSAETSSCPPVTSWIAPSGIAPFIASKSAMFVWRASEPPLRIAAFPLFKQSAAASAVTPGRAS